MHTGQMNIYTHHLPNNSYYPSKKVLLKYKKALVPLKLFPK